LHHAAPVFLWKVISGCVVWVCINLRRRDGHGLALDVSIRRRISES